MDRPLSLGLLHLQLLQKTARLAALPSPKLLILAGSNGPYSHSCVVLSAMLNMPCENGGIAVGIGLDDIFIRYAPLLRPGDVVYMPMELAQYVQSRAQVDAGVDGGFLIRHDRAVLAQLPADRILGAMFCCNLADLLEAAAEFLAARAAAFQPARLLAAEYDAEGDRTDNTAFGADPALLAQQARGVPKPGEIRQGYGTRLIARFVAREEARGVTVIGGLPVDFADITLPPGTLAVLAGLYTQNGGQFAVLANLSLYPRRDFFNSEDHLVQACQARHSILVAGMLAAALHRHACRASPALLGLARPCGG